MEKIVDRCLERDIEARYQRAAELRKDLEVQLAAVSTGNPSARLVGFLYTRGHAEPADLATLDIGELVSAEPSIDLSGVEAAPGGESIEIDLDTDIDESAPAAGGRRRAKLLAAIVALVAVSALVTYAVAPTETAAALRRALDWATALVQ